MKGQFFIIATVVIISTLAFLIQDIFVYRRIDLTKTQEVQELKYIEDIKDTMTSTFKNSASLRFEADLNETENFLKNRLIQKGIKLDIKHNVVIGGVGSYNMVVDYNITSSKFFSSTSFTVTY